MTRGTVLSYDPNEKVGFINPDDDDDRIPFDRKSLVNYPDDEHPAEGERVTFHVEGGMAGLWATHVTRIE